MKNLILLIIGLATALPFLNGQQNASINLDIDEINSVGLSINAIVTISESNTQKISIQGPNNLINNINTNVNNGNWNIKYDDKSNHKNADQLNITIQVKSLKSLAISGTGTINTEGRFSRVRKRSIAISGTGSVTLKGDSDHMNIALSGSGQMDIDCNAENMHVALSGNGDINIKGSVSNLHMSANGSGNIGGKGLKANNCKATISGSSILTAEVTDKLNLIESGSGTFRYRGNPSIKKIVNSRSALQKF